MQNLFYRMRRNAKACWRSLVVLWQTLFYRAWITTLGLFIVAIAFLYLGQTADILSNIQEWLAISFRLKLAKTPLPFNPETAAIQGYAFFWFGALVLAVALALIARVTGQPREEAQRVAHYHSNASQKILLFHFHGLDQYGLFRFLSSAEKKLQKDEDENRYFLNNFAALVLFATLGLIHFAFVSQGPGPFSPLMPLLLPFAVFTCIGILSFGLQKRRGALLVALLLVIGFLGLLVYFQRPNGAAISLALSSATPALGLLTVLLAPRPSDSVAKTALCIMALILALAVYYPFWRITDLWAFGSAAIVLIFLAFALSALACFVLLLRWVSARFMPIDRFVVVVLAGIFLLFIRPERVGQEKLIPLIPFVSDERQEIPLKKLHRPQFAIHADGGGLRAAMFTAEVLALADDFSCGDFGEHVLAASGVSGGSLGIATWAIMRQEYRRREVAKNAEDRPWHNCKEIRNRHSSGTNVSLSALHQSGRISVEEIETPLERLVAGALLRDHLSPVLYDALKSDLLLPGSQAKRGQALLASWQLAAQGASGSFLRARALATSLVKVNAGVNPKPVLMFTATNVDTGGRVVFSNDYEAISAYRDENLSIGEAALHSARFPLISPPGVLSGGERVVDGGYFDNSGAATLWDFLIKAANKSGSIEVLRIDGNPPELDDQTCKDFNKTLGQDNYLQQLVALSYSYWRWILAWAIPDSKGWSPLKAYGATRTAHSNEAAGALEKVQQLMGISSVRNAKLDYFSVVQECLRTGQEPETTHQDCMRAACLMAASARRAPLGWYMSPSSFVPIQLSAIFAARDILDKSNEESHR